MNRNFALYFLFQLFFFNSFNTNCMSNKVGKIKRIIGDIRGAQEKMESLLELGFRIGREPRVIIPKKIKIPLFAFYAIGLAIAVIEYSKTGLVESVWPYLGLLSFIIYSLSYFVDDFQEEEIQVKQKKCWSEISSSLDCYEKNIKLLEEELVEQDISFIDEIDRAQLICYSLRLSILREIEESKKACKKYIKIDSDFKTICRRLSPVVNK